MLWSKDGGQGPGRALTKVGGLPGWSKSPWPWRVDLEDRQGIPPKPCPSCSWPRMPLPLCPERRWLRQWPSSSRWPSPSRTALPLYKAPWQQKAHDNTPFLYLNISKHLAETFIFSLPQGEEVIRENGTNIPICQKQKGSELKGKFYHLTEQNQPRRDCKGLFRLPSHPVCFSQATSGTALLKRWHGAKIRFPFCRESVTFSGPSSEDPLTSSWVSTKTIFSYKYNYVKCIHIKIYSHQREKAPEGNALNTKPGSVTINYGWIIFLLLFSKTV